MEEKNNKEEMNIENENNNTAKSGNFETTRQKTNIIENRNSQSKLTQNNRLADKIANSNNSFNSARKVIGNPFFRKNNNGQINNINNFSGNNQGGNYNPFARIKTNRFSGINGSRNSINNNEQNVESKESQKGGIAGGKAVGMPNPLTAAVSKTVGGGALKGVGKALKIKLAIILIPVGLVLFLIIFSALNSDSSGDEQAKEIAQSEEMTAYLYSEGNEESLYKMLIDQGICDTAEECKDTQAATFYAKLKEVITGKDDETKKIAANFIIELTRYERGDESTDEEKGRYDTIDEIEFISSIILADGSLNEKKLKSYKGEFIKDGGYFDIYRTDLLNKSKDNSELKLEIFNKVVENVIDIKKGINNKTSITSGCVYGDIDIASFETMSHDEYISVMGPLAQADYTNTGILASVTLAQSIIESGWGTSGLTQKCKNFFGMKEGSVFSKGGWDGESVCNMTTREEVNGQDIIIRSNFRKYDTVGDSIADHSALFLGASRYKKVLTETTYQGQIQAIKDAGYATDSDYVSTIVNTINKYNLDVWDVKMTTNVCNNNMSGKWTLRSVAPTKNDSAFNHFGKPNVGQCVWYAQGRAVEITQELIANNTIDPSVGTEIINRLGRILGSGEAWYKNTEGLFKRSNNYKDVKAGSIISWSGGSNSCTPACGHVAVVESVTENEVVITDGWANGGNSCPNDWGCIRFRSKTMSLEEFYNWVPNEGAEGISSGRVPKKFEGYIYFLELEG